MSYIIFEVKTDDVGNINKLMKDDLVSRQSLLTRDASALDIDKDVSYLKIEGSEEGLEKATDLAEDFGFTKLSEEDAEEINKKILAEEEEAADGMGMIFG
ncbi:MAG: hypothetical protein KGY67_01605 [Candidatus Thermoplasmatota archaeon]|nr:hypothetical protein [Candidatus Thermoplasmatota archaeon]